MAESAAGGVIEAAGGIVRRRQGDVVEVLLVHRQKYDDWTFPKGKLEPGETLEECALREVEEETGLRCTLGRELVGTTYEDRHGRPKTVRYWLMEVEAGEFAPNREVDAIRWCDVHDEAAHLLTYRRDADVLRSLSAAEGPPTG